MKRRVWTVRYCEWAWAGRPVGVGRAVGGRGPGGWWAWSQWQEVVPRVRHHVVPQNDAVIGSGREPTTAVENYGTWTRRKNVSFWFLTVCVAAHVFVSSHGFWITRRSCLFYFWTVCNRQIRPMSTSQLKLAPCCSSGNICPVSLASVAT